MRQLYRMFVFDLRMTMSSFMGGYMLIVPMVILMVLRVFIPTVETTSYTVAVVAEGPNAVHPEMIEVLDPVADLVVYPDIESMEEKLRGSGQAEGLYFDPAEGQYVSVLERSQESNKAFSFAAKFIRLHHYQTHYPQAERLTEFSHGVPAELAERSETSPVASIGGATFIIFLVIIGGFLIGMAVVNDKDLGTILALRVSPVSRADYFIGRSIFPLLATVFYAGVSLLMLGLTHVDLAQLALVIVASFPLTLLVGLFIGAMGDNEVEAIGIGKLASMVLMLAILGPTLLPDAWHWVVWWSPSFWLYDVVEEIFTESAQWGSLLWKSAVMMGVTGIYFGLLRKQIVRGLS
jgi:ABC-2 type transport system permease protein